MFNEKLLNNVNEIKIKLKNRFKDTYKNDYYEVFNSDVKYKDLIGKVDFDSCVLNDGFYFSEKRRTYEDNELLLERIKNKTGLIFSYELIKVLNKINDTVGLSKDIQIDRNSSFKEIFVVLDAFYKVDLDKIKIQDIIYLLEFADYVKDLSRKAS